VVVKMTVMMAGVRLVVVALLMAVTGARRRAKAVLVVVAFAVVVAWGLQARWQGQLQ
jgi:hypothetical protein